jgi:hypothetical protein
MQYQFKPREIRVEKDLLMMIVHDVDKLVELSEKNFAKCQNDISFSDREESNLIIW